MSRVQSRLFRYVFTVRNNPQPNTNVSKLSDQVSYRYPDLPNRRGLQLRRLVLGNDYGLECIIITRLQNHYVSKYNNSDIVNAIKDTLKQATEYTMW